MSAAAGTLAGACVTRNQHVLPTWIPMADDRIYTFMDPTRPVSMHCAPTCARCRRLTTGVRVPTRVRRSETGATVDLLRLLCVSWAQVPLAKPAHTRAHAFRGGVVVVVVLDFK